MELNLIFSFIFFLVYLIFPQRVEFKVLTTLSFLSLNSGFNWRILLFSVGDYLITKPHLFTSSIFFFLLGSLNPEKDIAFIILITNLFAFFPQTVLYLYILNHLKSLFFSPFYYFNLFLILSDIIIGIDEYMYPIKNSRYITYPLYYLSLYSFYYQI